MIAVGTAPDRITSTSTSCRSVRCRSPSAVRRCSSDSGAARHRRWRQAPSPPARLRLRPARQPRDERCQEGSIVAGPWEPTTPSRASTTWPADSRMPSPSWCTTPVGAETSHRSIPNAEPGLSPMEISQRGARALRLGIKEENLPASRRSVSGRTSPRCRRSDHGPGPPDPRGHALREQPIDMPLSMLLGKLPVIHKTVEPPVPRVALDTTSIDITEALGACSACPVASKSFLITIGDRSITGFVARDQMVGPWQSRRRRRRHHVELRLCLRRGHGHGRADAGGLAGRGCIGPHGDR